LAEDGAGPAPDLRPDAGAQVGDLDGGVRVHGRGVQQLRDPPGGRQDRARRRLRPRLPAPAGGPAQRPDDPAGADQGAGDPAAAMTATKLPEGVVLARGVIAGAEWITVSREPLRETLSWLKGQGYESYGFMTCVDHLASQLPE